jgi:hypothetical protein
MMKKTILKFGLISGVLATVMMLATAPFIEKLSGNTGYMVGYTTIVLAFLLVYFGIRSYRDDVGHGQISFGRGFVVGISIALIMCAFYVATWEILYFTVLHGVMDNYGAHAVEQMKASGASAAKIQAKVQEMNQMKVMLQNPLFNIAMTFIEPFPVGLVMTLISAAILRRRGQRVAAGSLSAEY